MLLPCDKPLSRLSNARCRDAPVKPLPDKALAEHLCRGEALTEHPVHSPRSRLAYRGVWSILCQTPFVIKPHASWANGDSGASG